MILVEAVLGNAAEPPWAQRLAGAEVDVFVLDHWEAQKNRLRKKTAGGTELAVSLDRGTFMRDGDVLVWDAPAARAVVAKITLRDVMVIHLDALGALAPEIAMRTCVELGHALGNQHWPALVKGNRVFVPLTVDRKVMSSVMNTHRFEGIAYEFVPGGEVVPYLAPHESRRLFGGAEGPVHTHTHEQYIAVDTETGKAFARPPVRAQSPGHTHTHADGQTHTHGDGHAHANAHAHTHGDGHTHTHAHDDGHSHAHDDGHAHPHPHPHGSDAPPRP
jgi:urease accessory protein